MYLYCKNLHTLVYFLLKHKCTNGVGAIFANYKRGYRSKNYSGLLTFGDGTIKPSLIEVEPIS